MSREEIETQFFKKYGCTTLFEFVDECLDFDTSLKVLEDYFEKSSQLDEANKKLDKIKIGLKDTYCDTKHWNENYYEDVVNEILSIIGGE